MDKPYDFIKKTLLSKKLLLAELHKIPEVDQNPWQITQQVSLWLCSALLWTRTDTHPQVLLCCNSFIQAAEKRHQVHKVNSLILTKTEVSYSK